MDSEVPAGVERVLVLSSDADASTTLRESLEHALPDLNIEEAVGIDHLQQRVNSEQFDLVVLDYELPLADYRQLFYELKNNEHQPSVLVVTDGRDSSTINELYKYGCSRCVLKDENPTQELPTAVRSLLRSRQIIDENIRIRTKLTEANMLLDERNKRLDEFSATVAHDIRGPLGGISMKLEYALDLYAGKLEPKCEDLMRRAVKSTERLTRIVQAMYDFAKLGVKATQMKEISLTELVAEVGEDLEFRDRPDARIVIDDFPTVWGNPELLRRVFINLVGNAVKYSGRPDPVIKIVFDGEQETVFGRFCRVNISDNGPGIPEKELPMIFSMFTRGTTSVDADDDGDAGMGVGLAVVQRIVELHYGRIEAQSELGLGTTFSITLPLENVALRRDTA